MHVHNFIYISYFSYFYISLSSITSIYWW